MHTLTHTHTHTLLSIIQNIIEIKLFRYMKLVYKVNME